MEKTKEQLIEAFKKNNKARREIIAKAKGFASAAEYLVAIYEGKTKRKAPKAKTRKETKVTPPVAPKVEAKKEMLDYIVAFDTTGSMNSYIGDVKKHVEKIIPEMFSQDIDLRMKIIAFGDYCDMNSASDFGTAYQQSQFTDNQNDLMKFVQNAQGTNGGDGDEFYELIIKKITEETPWREGAKRAVLFIADQNPHKVGYSYSNNSYGSSYKRSAVYIVQNAQIDWKQEAKKAAEKSVAFDTLAIHGEMYPWYKELSSITGGVYMPFKSSNKMAEVVKMSAYSRGSRTSKAKFAETMATAIADGDEELIGTYKSLSTLL
jgi:hypothetical protein